MATRVAVLGSNSFSGSDFIDLLLDQAGYEVLGISRSPQKGPVFLPYLRHTTAKFKFQQADMNTNTHHLLRLLDDFRPAYVVNFAAQSEVAPSWQAPWDWFQTNTVALSHLCHHLSRIRYLKKYVHVSSPEVYGTCRGRVKEDAPLNPSTPYAASKAAADLLLAVYFKNTGFPVVTVRATNVYGAHQQLFKIVPRSVIAVKSKKVIELHGGGKAVKSYIHVRDVSRGELSVMLKGKIGELYHFSPDEGIAVRDLVRLICDKMEVSFQQYTKTVAERPGQDKAYVIDSGKARRQLGWRPKISLDKGLEEVITWVERYWDDIRDLPKEYKHKK